MDRKEVKVVRTQDVPAVTPVGDTTVEGIKSRRLITKKRAGSEKLQMGIVHLDPGCKGYKFTAGDEDEVYYILRGRVTLQYDGKKVDAEERDAIFLPPNLKYQLENPGTEPAEIVYVLTPPIVSE